MSEVPPFPVPDDCRDQWVIERVRFHLAVEDSFHNGLAAGVFLRLCEPTGRQLPQSVSESPAHSWVSGLTPEQKDELFWGSMARLDGMWMRLEDLQRERETDFDEDEWQKGLLRLCQGRDEFEGLFSLLIWAEIPQASWLTDRVLGFDAVALEFVSNVPDLKKVRNEHMDRAGWMSPFPFCWWTVLADY